MIQVNTSNPWCQSPYCHPTHKLKLENWRYFGVKLFGTGRDIMGLYEQNRVLIIDTKVLFYTWDDLLGHLTWN